jgi:uncharacterized protein (DUF362 family)
MSKVVIVRCGGYGQEEVDAAVRRQIELLGGVGQFIKPGQTILIKPNFIAPKARELAVQTDPAVLIAIAKICKDAGAKPFIGDSPAWGDVESCAAALGMTEELKRLGVLLKGLGRPKRCYIKQARTAVRLSSDALEADAIINVPKLKTHQQLGATIAVKNMFGCVCGKWKPYWHFARGSSQKRFCELLLDIYDYLGPVLTIVDGITAMDAGGPIQGRARHVGLLAASEDSIACEVVCARAVGIDPVTLPVIRTALKVRNSKLKSQSYSSKCKVAAGITIAGGQGEYPDYGRPTLKECDDSELPEIEIVGDVPDRPICSDFEMPELIPIRFSLIRVAKSAVKQVFIKVGFVKTAR